MKMKRILVTGVGGPAGINFVECLRMAPEKMYIVGTDVNKWHLELPEVNRRYPVPECTKKNYVSKLNELIKKEKIEFVHPQPDIEVKVLSENREKINATTFLPNRKTIDLCQDKIKTNEVLRGAGVPAPKIVQIRSEKDLDIAFDELKGRSKQIWFRARKGAGSKASLPIEERRHAKVWIEYWMNKGLTYGDFMACEFLPGKEFAFQSVWKDGELVTSMARQRLEYLFGNIMPSGQSSSPSVARTVHREDVNDIATRAVLTVDKKASGIFCIDLKENVNGISCVTEINAGRFFTTSNFFAKIGANMPYTYVRLAYGEKIPNLPKYNAAPKGIYWVRSVDKEPILVKSERWKSAEI
jgi:glutathione synthase/RimK-type ligase-like ATP-grasp enzyme